MSAGELTFDDLPLDDNPIYVLTFAFFIVLILFVIMNLMTSVAVNDLQEIRNQSRDGAWYKLMLTLMWYHAALHRYKHYFNNQDQEMTKNDNIICFKLNRDETSLSDPATWFYFLFKMPDSVKAKAQMNKRGVPSDDTFSIVHNIDMDIVIIFGTTKSFKEVILKKGKVHKRNVSYWKTKFAIVDYEDGYDKQRNMYRAQAFSKLGAGQLEIKFTTYGSKGKFEVFDQAEPSTSIQGTVKQYFLDA